MKRVIVILILIIIITMCGLITAIINGINLSKINFMYEDITTLDDAIAIYYLDYGNIPIKEKVEFKNSINPNDNDVYYKIDLKKLDNIYLNYGKEDKNKNDIYIINEQSHTVYYLNGIEYKGKKQYTRNVNYSLVELK